MSGEYHRTRVAAYAIFRDGDKVLFMRRANTGFMDGRLGLPAGHIELGETVVDGLSREIKEEVGVDVGADSLEFVFAGHRYEPAGEFDYVDFYFEVSSWQGEFINAEPEKCSELVWVEADKIEGLDEVIDYERSTFSDINKGLQHRSMERGVSQ